MAIQWGRRGTVTAVLAVALLVSACGMFGKHATKGEDAEDDIAAEEPAEDPAEKSHQSVLDLLDEDERDAVDRSGMSGMLTDADGAATEMGGPFSKERRSFDGEPESTADKAGKLSISVLSVALSAAAVAAPFLLF